MPTMDLNDDISLGAVVLGRVSPESMWPIPTQWRAAILVRGEFQSVEWAMERVKPVPLSSRLERTLLDAVRSDDGRAVLAQASEPGEHRAAAGTLAALRLAGSHPDRALRFLAWIKQSPDDPGSLRFLRRYLPQLHVLVQLEPDLGVALPLGRISLDLLSAELLRASGQSEAAETVLSALPASAPVAVARASLRVSMGDIDGAHDLAADRPIVDDVSAALRVVDARAHDLANRPEEALKQLAVVFDEHVMVRPIERAALGIRARALRATGRDVEASLVESELGLKGDTPHEPIVSTMPEPQPPLFGRSLTDAMDDAWARVKRQPSDHNEAFDAETVAHQVDDAVALIKSGQFDAAETTLLRHIDRVDDQVDAGRPVIDDFFVLLAGMFDSQGLTVEEVATLERLRAAHGRAGTPIAEEIQTRLVEARSALDGLA